VLTARTREMGGTGYDKGAAHPARNQCDDKMSAERRPEILGPTAGVNSMGIAQCDPGVVTSSASWRIRQVPQQARRRSRKLFP